MLFNSYVFIFGFLPLSLLGAALLLRISNPWALKSWLSLCSLVFYAWASQEWLLLLLASAGFNFFMARQISRNRNSSRIARTLLIIGIAINIGVLVYFKYRGELTFAINHLFARDLPLPKVILPLAISFFSFHQVAYLVDVYLKRIEAETRPINYLLFVSFFPHLIAGPIIYYREFKPQLTHSQTFHPQIENLKFGAYLFAIGLAKKTCIADPIGTWVDNGFSNAHQLNQGESIAVTYLFGLQLYFDFSAYCDMALGLARIFNIQFPLNFNSPYQAKNLQEFWLRWHITLGRFFRDYVYVPLGGNRISFTRQQINLLIVMVLSGLWHGSNWLFFLWGLWHGIGMIALHCWRRIGISLHPLIGLFLTVNFWVLSLVFFRSHHWDQTTDLYRNIFTWSGGEWLLQKNHFISDSSAFYWLIIPNGLKELSSSLLIGGSLLTGYLLCIACPNAYQLTENNIASRHYWLKLGALFTLGLFMITNNSPFIYFQF